MILKRSEFLNCAVSIGEKLCNEAIWEGTRCNWLGFSSEPEPSSPDGFAIAYRSFGPDIYSGTSGIALFLSQLYLITREKIFYKTSNGAMRQALSRLDDVPDQSIFGFYSGLIGIAYACLQVGVALDQEEFLRYSQKIVRQLAKKNSVDHGIDVIAGNASAIPTLINLYTFHKKKLFPELAIRLGDELLISAKKERIGWSWGDGNSIRRTKQRNLNGFAHGAAGFGWGLLELYHQTNQQEYADAAERAFDYERHWYNKKEENWPDFREIEFQNGQSLESLSYPVQWCHGAPGIGLSRIRAYQVFGKNIYLEEVNSAIRTTIKMLENPYRFGQNNYSLCHGLGGNSELLILCSQILNDKSLKEIADKVGERGLESYQKKNLAWPCGIPQGETPGLMLGLAGIGYFYLRLYDPVTIYPVLILLPDK